CARSYSNYLYAMDYW
nr:immunoglobulin heavy chain junction region [Mus musculus]MBK4196926.1 immunoglobulin heavy chain junction region [Mus musculus]MBK4196927.1 immunoglobulin heavy chain junction region [Mus musculus]MBK4196928.1 immunoglobulin heavy chain junction region [Mus musculus]MBK4196929.1 immunoglobulin heavy chain junction region [Mus musculus]